MRLSWLQFERGVRRKIRAELARDPNLRRRYRGDQKRARGSGVPFLRRALFTYIFTALFISLLAKTDGFRVGLAVIALWSTGTAFRRGGEFFHFFYGSGDLLTLTMLPLRDSEIFSVQWGRFLRNGAWLIVYSLIFYLVLGLSTQNPASSAWPFFGAALLQAALVFALGLISSAWLGSLPLAPIGGIFQASALGMLLLPRLLPNQSDWFLNAVLMCLPSGWINYLLLPHSAGADSTRMLLLVPIAIMIAGAYYAWHKLRHEYSLEGIEFSLASTPPPADDEEEIRLGPTEIKDNIVERQFLAPMPWRERPFVERCISFGLTPREKLVAEFLLGQAPDWTHSFKWGIVLFAISISVLSVLGKGSGPAIIFLTYFLGITLLPLAGGRWLGMNGSPTGGGFIPPYALYPVSFNDIARVIFKVNLMLMALGTPFLLVFGLFAGWKLEFGLAKSALFTTKILGLALAIQPLNLVFPFSRVSRDSKVMRWIWWIVFVPLLLIMAGMAVAVLLVEDTRWTSMLFLGVFSISLLIFVSFRYAYRRGAIDLMSHRQEEPG